MNTDGNTAAIERHLAEQEAHDAAQPVILYCRPCDEIISSEDWPSHVYRGTCPDCGGDIEEIR